MIYEDGGRELEVYKASCNTPRILVVRIVSSLHCTGTRSFVIGGGSTLHTPLASMFSLDEKRPCRTSGCQHVLMFHDGVGFTPCGNVSYSEIKDVRPSDLCKRTTSSF